MKSTLRILQCGILGLMLLFAGCNSEVFIDEFLSDSLSVSLSETEKDVAVCFESDNWNVLSIENLRSDVSVFVTDLEGQNQKMLPFEDGETGAVSCRNTFLDFRVEKRNGRELHFVSGENLYNYPFEVAVRVGNRYDEKVINVSFSPTCKYQLDSVVYDWSEFYFSDNMLEIVDEMVVNTMHGSRPVTMSFYPYRSSVRKVEFSMRSNGLYMEEEYLRNLLGEEQLQVEIPDRVGGLPGLYGTKASFRSQLQSLEVNLDKTLKVEKTVAPGKKVRLEVFNGVEQYDIPYKAYLSNPVTGKTQIISGMLSSTTPFNYLILPIEITDENE